MEDIYEITFKILYLFKVWFYVTWDTLQIPKILFFRFIFCNIFLLFNRFPYLLMGFKDDVFILWFMLSLRHEIING